MDFSESFRRAGSGEPLVLIHGFSGAWQHWRPVMLALQQHHDVLAAGLAGHYRSRPFDGSASLGAAVDMLERDLDDAGFDTAHIVGNSLGGLVAFELARRGRARSVIGLAPAGGWESGSQEARRLLHYFRAQHQAGKLTLPHADRLFRSELIRKLSFFVVMAHAERMSPADAVEMLTASVECPAYFDVLAAGERDGMPPDYDGVDCPVLLAWPEKDRLLTIRRYSERLRRLIPHAEWQVLPGVGHVPMHDDPVLVANTILDWTARHTAVAPGVPGAGGAGAVQPAA
jgi:pimeloyl-ACP methyl ester carboxylesterase